MKPRTYFGIALLFPYILWCICALVIFILSSQEISEPWNVVLTLFFFYAFGILFWFIPYTILAVGIWLWSHNKSLTVLYKTAIVAPILLCALILVESTLLSLPVDSLAELLKKAAETSFLLGGFSLVFGYLCVGFALVVFKFLQAGNLIAEEAPLSVSQLNQLPISV